jgi:hypothetical protein
MNSLSRSASYSEGPSSAGGVPYRDHLLPLASWVISVSICQIQGSQEITINPQPRISLQASPKLKGAEVEKKSHRPIENQMIKVAKAKSRFGRLIENIIKIAPISIRPINNPSPVRLILFP